LLRFCSGDMFKKICEAFAWRRIQKFRGRSVVLDLATIKEDQTATDIACELHFMCDNDHSHTSTSQLAHDLKHFMT
jgi:hypothetical protein